MTAGSLRSSSQESHHEQLPAFREEEAEIAAANEVYTSAKDAHKTVVQQHDELREQQELELASKPKAKPNPATETELAELAAAAADRKQEVDAAKRRVKEAERVLNSKRQLSFVRIQSVRNVQLSRMYAENYVTAFDYATQALDEGKVMHEEERRRARLAAQKEARERRELLRAMSFDTNLDRFASKFKGSWREGKGFPPAPRAAPTVWLPPEPPPVGEPEALTALKASLGRNLSRVIDLFKKWDVDCDHTIGIDELRLALGALEVPHDEKVLNELFLQLDGDKSGSIDFDELHHALRKHAPKRAPPNHISLSVPKRREQLPEGTGSERRAVAALKKALHANLQRVRDLFGVWDIDGDGQVSVAELERALAGLCIPIDKPAIKRLFAQIDSDGSGAVDYTELEALLKQDLGEDDIADLATNGPVKSDVRILTRPQSSPQVGRSGRRRPPSQGFRPSTAGSSASLPTLARPSSVPQNLTLSRKL